MKYPITWLALALFLWAAPQPLRAETDFLAPVLSRLEAEGFTITEVRRTWLGRILVTATDSQNLREVVLNRHNGEVLRDRLFPSANPRHGAGGSNTQAGHGDDGQGGGGMDGGGMGGGGMGDGGMGGGHGGGQGGGQGGGGM